MDTAAIKKAMNEVLNDHRNISQELHSDDHEFIAMLKERERKRVEFWQKAKLSFVGTIASTLVVVLAWIGMLVIEALKNGNHPGN